MSELRHAQAKLRPDSVTLLTSEWEAANEIISDHIENHEDQASENAELRRELAKEQNMHNETKADLSRVRGQLRMLQILYNQLRETTKVG